MGDVGRDVEDVPRAHPRGKKRLVRITERRVHEQQALVRAHSLRKRLRSSALQDLTQALGWFRTFRKKNQYVRWA